MEDQEKIRQVKGCLNLRYSAEELDTIADDRWLEMWDIMAPLAREHKRHIEGEDPEVYRVDFEVFSRRIAVVPPAEQWLDVESSNIGKIAQGAYMEIFVKFKATDKIYMYASGRSQRHFWSMYSADSPGSYFHKNLKPKQVDPELMIQL